MEEVSEQASVSPENPLLHADGKLLSDIIDSKKVVDHVAILVTGADMEQLLASPKSVEVPGRSNATPVSVLWKTGN